jgi:hypothetical protein
MRSTGGWRAGWIESTRPILRHWRRQRLHLHGLTGANRLLAALALGAILVACGLVLVSSVGAVLPGHVTEIPGRLMATDDPVAVPGLAVLLGCLGLAIGASAIAAGSAGQGRAAGRLFVVLVLTLAGLGGLLLAMDGAVRLLASLVQRANPLVVPVYEVATLFAFVAAVAVAIAPVARSRWVRAAAPPLAAVPFLGIAAAVLLAGDASATLSPWVQAQSLDYPARLDLSSSIVSPLLTVVVSAAGLLALLSIWQASEFSKAAVRHVGTALAISGTRWTGLLAALLVAKVAWLGAGILGYLPPALGGSSEIWPAIESDDAFAWAYAAALAIGGLTWLIRDRRRISEERAQATAGRTVLLFAGVAFVITALPLVVAALAGAGSDPRAGVPADVTLGDCARDWFPSGASAALSCVALALVPWQSVWWFAIVIGALAAGLWILRRAPSHGGGILLAAVGAWSLPRAIDALSALHPSELAWLGNLPAVDAPQPETLDVVLTVLVAVLAIGWWSGRQRRIDAGPLLVILAVSTLLIDGPSIAPSAPGALLVAVGIVFPVLYELGFDSGGTNRPSVDRTAVLLRKAGLRALALTVLAILLVIDIAALHESTQGRLGFILFAVPLSATIVAATVRRRLPIAQAASPQRARPLVAGAALGLASVVVIGGLGWALQPILAAIYPTPATRVQELEARFTSLDTALQAIDVFDPAVPASLQQRWTEERSWTTSHPPPSCAADLWVSWTDLLVDVRHAGIVIAAVTDQPVGAPDSEVAAVQAALQGVGAALGEHLTGVRTDLERAATAC